ncbi:MAG: helix-turn-helix domain-containing protein [Oscillospiraceae bacterium]
MEGYHLESFWFSLLRSQSRRALWHPELEIIFLLQGTGRVYFSDLKTAYALREKDIFVVNSFEVQDFELDGESTALSFSVTPEFVGQVAPELLKYKVNCRSFLYVEEKQAAFDVLRQDLARAFQALNKRERSGTSYSKSSAAALLEDLNRFFLDDRQPAESGRVQETLKKVTHYIQDHYRERITLDELARHTFLSKTYLSRCFTRYLGISFTGYVELLRLSNASRLLAGQGSLAEIAEESGFPSANAMIRAFKRCRGVTPGAYRQALRRGEGPLPGPELPEEGSGVFAALLRYAAAPSSAMPVTERVQEVTVDTAGKKEPLSAHWKRLLNVGYARSLTDERVRRELRRLQESVGFEFLRVKGVLDDDMCLLRLDMNGNPVMNFAYVDEGIDFILSVGAKPMLELSFMPSLLAKNPVARSMRGAILSGPKDLAAWQELIGRFMAHLTERYGRETVALWLFSPWLSPDFIDMGLCTREEYADIYAASCHAIRAAVPRALIAGPGSVAFPACWSWYLEMCRSRDCMPDVLSFRSYAAVGEREEDGMKLIGNNESFSFAVSEDEDFLAHTAARIRDLVGRDGMDDRPLILEEWSNNIWQRDLCNDTCYKSAYLFKNILENNQSLSAMGYFSLNDRLDEVPPSAETFHGGFGLFTQDDIPKSACLALELLAQMGDRLLRQGDGYLVSQRGQELQIFLYNYSHYDLLYRYRHVVNMSRTNREQVFVRREPRAYYIRLANLPEGSYQVCRYGITRAGGSSYDSWVRMGAPSPLSHEERELLRRLACPEYHRERMQTSGGELHIRASLAPQDVWLIRIKKL